MMLSLELNNFRNWKKKTINFDPVTVLIGPNGVGKSNILEAIVAISTSRSYRAQFDRDMIMWGESFTRLTAVIKKIDNNDEQKANIELVIKKEANSIIKRLKIQGAEKKLIEILGISPVIIFTPETIDLVLGSPRIRRRFLDIILSQVDRYYAYKLIQLQKILKNRSHILQLIKMNSASLSELDFWDHEMLEEGSYIFKKRFDLLEKINNIINESYQIISGFKDKDKIEINYIPAVRLKSNDDIKNRYRDFLSVFRQEEINKGLNLAGPHRDDFKILINGKDSSKFSSRGEIRSIVLALKMAELDFIKNSDKIKNPPVLLLDDVFSELDENRRNHLLLLTKEQQTIITTTDIEHIGKIKKEAKIIDLGKNKE